MHRAFSVLGSALAILGVLSTPAWANPRKLTECVGPADPVPCLLKGSEADRSRLPVSGPAAWVRDNKLVISWVGEADEVRVTGNMQFPGPMPAVAPNLHQFVVQYPKAQQTRTQLQFAVKRDGKLENLRQLTELVEPSAYTVLTAGDIAEQTVMFGEDVPKARVWLPPGYRKDTRYPALYLADGGWTSPGSWLTNSIRSGKVAPLIVVGVDYALEQQEEPDSRRKTYLGGTQSADFLAHERFLLDTVIPTIEARYGAPPERRLRAIGGASNGGVWAASMALRNPAVFGTAFVMSPGIAPAQHGNARSLVRLYISAGDLEPGFRWNAECLAGDIVARGGVATFTTYPSGHDTSMWGRIMLDDVRDWLTPQAPIPLLAALPDASCNYRPPEK